MTAPNLILCEACGSEGHLYNGHPNDPHPVYVGECPTCRGTGLMHAEIGLFPDREAKPDLAKSMGEKT